MRMRANSNCQSSSAKCWCKSTVIIMTFTAARHVLDRMEADYTLLPSGCCGMAGSFGFEADKVEISKKAAERVLLPAVRQAEPETVILANGFSCREQIEQGTG